jgi:hypothetical protein
MAENDNSDRPRSNGSQGTPEKSFTTNNVRSISNGYYTNDSNDKQPIRKSNDSKPTQTPTKKGK